VTEGTGEEEWEGGSRKEQEKDKTRGRRGRYGEERKRT
jgi:hypothetical protein